MRLANKTRKEPQKPGPKVRGDAGRGGGGVVPGGLGPAGSCAADAGPPLRAAAARAASSLAHDHGALGLIYCRKPLKAQELWRAWDNRHKARI